MVKKKINKGLLVVIGLVLFFVILNLKTGLQAIVAPDITVGQTVSIHARADTCTVSADDCIAELFITFPVIGEKSQGTKPLENSCGGASCNLNDPWTSTISVAGTYPIRVVYTNCACYSKTQETSSFNVVAPLCQPNSFQCTGYGDLKRCNSGGTAWLSYGNCDDISGHTSSCITQYGDIIDDVCESSPTDSCSDTDDNGKTISVKGTVSGYFSGSSYSLTDYCWDCSNQANKLTTGNCVLEYWCEGDKSAIHTDNCDGNGCTNGACNQAQTCAQAGGTCLNSPCADFNSCIYDTGTCPSGQYCCTGTCAAKTCNDLGGICCTGSQTCTGTTVTASDCNVCCTGYGSCTEGPCTDYDYRCIDSVLSSSACGGAWQSIGNCLSGTSCTTSFLLEQTDLPLTTVRSNMCGSTPSVNCTSCGAWSDSTNECGTRTCEPDNCVSSDGYGESKACVKESQCAPWEKCKSGYDCIESDTNCEINWGIVLLAILAIFALKMFRG